MSTHESFDHLSLPDMMVPDGFEAAADEFAYQALCERLFELNITTSGVKYYRIPKADGDWLSVLTRPQELCQAERDEAWTGLRIIANHETTSDETGLPAVTVDDFVIDFQNEALVHHRDAVQAENTPEGVKWRWHTKMPPHIWGSNTELKLHRGVEYEATILPSESMEIKDAARIADLLAVLHGASETTREDVLEFTPFAHQND